MGYRGTILLNRKNLVIFKISKKAYSVTNGTQEEAFEWQREKVMNS
jgi:hypothetical protein